MGFREIGFFTVKIKGVEFTGKRRSTALMLEIGDVRRVFGMLAKSKKGDVPPEEGAKASADYVKMTEKALALTLVKIDGVPVEELGLLAGELNHVADAYFSAFIDSGLSADPIAGSLKGDKEPS